MLRKQLFILLLFISPACFSQSSIVGVWEGKFLSSGTSLGEPKLVVEIYNFKDSIFTGVTHLYYEGDKYEHYKMIGLYNKRDSLLVFEEASTIAVDLGGIGNCLGTYITSLQKQGNDLVQYGMWRSNIRGCSFDTRIWLKKKVEEIKKEVPPVKEKAVAPKPAPALHTVKGKMTAPVITTAPVIAPVKTEPVIKTVTEVIPAKIAQRETDIQSLLEIAPADKDSIKVEVYDNGEIDGDSVSVYVDQVQRVNKKMISLKPITFYVSLDKKLNPISHLRLVAESLGSIPPCTALMIVTTKSKRYEVHLSSNFNKNATVELFLKE